MDRVHPIGQIRYKKVKLGHSGKKRKTHTKRMRHIYTNVETVGIIGLLSPRIVAHMISLMPMMKYVLEIIIIFCCEYFITSGVDDIRDESCPEKIADREPKVAPKAIVI